MKFYNGAKRESVEVDVKECEKLIFSSPSGAQNRYAIRAIDDDGHIMTKFVSHDLYSEIELECSGKVHAHKKKTKGFIKRLVNSLKWA